MEKEVLVDRHRAMTLLAALAVLVAACSTDPTTSQQYVDLQEELAAAVEAKAAVDRQLVEVAAERDALALRLAEPSGSAEATAAMVMKAWDTGDSADIDAVYAADVLMVIDTETYASDREELAGVITGAMSIGNIYRQVGPVVEYLGSDGDTYLATLVVVTGPGHPSGAPVVGFYRVRDGKVIRHILLDAEGY